jgi:hypothetical protein
LFWQGGAPFFWGVPLFGGWLAAAASGRNERSPKNGGPPFVSGFALGRRHGGDFAPAARNSSPA